jgi:hypothetical protein
MNGWAFISVIYERQMANSKRFESKTFRTMGRLPWAGNDEHGLTIESYSL